MYDTDFYGFLKTGSLRSAGVVLPLMLKHFAVKTVVDFGCGQGAWLKVWQGLGVSVCGIDGAYVKPQSLLFSGGDFLAKDLGQAIDLGRSFDLVQSLEVAEHLDAAAAETFVATLVRHAPVVLFSAAVPGQMGTHHVNEQPYSYWRRLFALHNFVMVDLIRPQIKANRLVESWYRYNIFVFMEESLFAAAAPELQAQAVAEPKKIPEFAPWWVKGYRRGTRLLPPETTTWICNWVIHQTAKEQRRKVNPAA